MNAEIKLMKTAAELGLAEVFARAKAALPGLAAERNAAFESFAATGLPHRRIEDWKYTDLRALMRDAKPLAAPPAEADVTRAKGLSGLAKELEARQLVFVNGMLVRELSDLEKLEPGLSIRSMSDALREGDPLIAGHQTIMAVARDNTAAALNTALMGDGALIHVAAGAVIERPLHLTIIAPNEGAAVYMRSGMTVEKGARVMLIESHRGENGADYQFNGALALQIADEAHVDHVKVIREGADALHLSTLVAEIGARVRFNNFTFTTGGKVVRNQMFVTFKGADTVAAVRGASLLRGRQHVDHTLVVDHVAPGCQSRDLFKAVLDDHARSVFQGKITVRQAAQRTDGRMMTRALLLSEHAEADNKPELEIFADNVQCGHGATTGALDEDLLFYLLARGIPRNQAEALLIESFAGEAIDGIEHAGLRDALMQRVGKWLGERA